MIESAKDIPEDVIKIQAAWIKAINRVAKPWRFDIKRWIWFPSEQVVKR
jgi:hypothetical protein